jgi:general stress protein 26
MLKSKVYEHNYNWVFLSSDHEAQKVFSQVWSTLLKIWFTNWKNKPNCVSLCFTLLNGDQQMEKKKTE